jgi:DNA polymerase-3 subunit epsilon
MSLDTPSFGTERSVLFDTETTGLDPLTGDRVIEFAAIELINDLPTDRHFHRLIHPERDIPTEASRIHGILISDLEGKPLFAAVAQDILDFIGDARLIAHNANFDFGFMDAEFARIGLPKLDRARMIDTLALAKTRFPGMPNSLDALCRRFDIDLSTRSTHNALLDCKLLAEVYVELTGGRQRGLGLADNDQNALPVMQYKLAGPRTPHPILVDEATLAAHAAFVARLKEPIWSSAAG